ncbi:hypothetical protein, partial [Mesorhizobium sp.]
DPPSPTRGEGQARQRPTLTFGASRRIAAIMSASEISSDDISICTVFPFTGSIRLSALASEY